MRKVKLGEIGITITGKTPSSTCPEDFGNDCIFITPSDNFEKKYIETTERGISKIGMSKLHNKILPKKSIVVTCIGSAMGKIALNKTEAITNQQINSIIPNDLFDADYIYYALKNNYKLLRIFAQGSTSLPLLNKTDFDELSLFLHNDIKTQQKIAKILSDLDDKIEVLSQLNDNLAQCHKKETKFFGLSFYSTSTCPFISIGKRVSRRAWRW